MKKKIIAPAEIRTRDLYSMSPTPYQLLYAVALRRPAICRTVTAPARVTRSGFEFDFEIIILILF